MPQSLAAIYLHAVFSTKNRVPYLKPPKHREDMFALLASISYSLDSPPIIVGGMPDHVHILFSLARTLSPANWIKEMKRASSAAWKQDLSHPSDFAWQHGYGLFSVSISNLAKVEAYIRDQEMHHEKQDFQTELRALLKRHHLAFDEAHVWN